MICPACCQPLPYLVICGVTYRAVTLAPHASAGEKTHIPKRYIWVGDDEVLYCPPIPLLVVERKIKMPLLIECLRHEICGGYVAYGDKLCSKCRKEETRREYEAQIKRIHDRLTTKPRNPKKWIQEQK